MTAPVSPPAFSFAGTDHAGTFAEKGCFDSHLSVQETLTAHTLQRSLVSQTPLTIPILTPQPWTAH